MQRSFPALFDGRNIAIRYKADLSDTAGNPAHAATFIRKRTIELDPELKRRPREHRRILLHEYFHFVWVRLGNPQRWTWEAHLRSEWSAGARGEAGWSAEWRKKALSQSDVRRRSPRWREYCCESFCDTAASVYGRVDTEVTLAKSWRRARTAWFQARFESRRFPI